MSTETNIRLAVKIFLVSPFINFLAKVQEWTQFWTVAINYQEVLSFFNSIRTKHFSTSNTCLRSNSVDVTFRFLSTETLSSTTSLSTELTQ